VILDKVEFTPEAWQHVLARKVPVWLKRGEDIIIKSTGRRKPFDANRINRRAI